MVDRLEAMSLLLLVAEKGSFTAAAKASGAPLPTVSRKISELEARLGAKLLVRTTRSLALTEAGAAYAASARRILEDLEAAERRAAGEYAAPRGELVVTAPVLFGRLYVLPIVTAFLAEYPQVSVRLLLSDHNLHLVEEHVDLAVRIGPLADSGLVATRVGKVRQVVCASPRLIAEFGTPRTPVDLARMPAAAFDPGEALSAWTFRDPESGGLVQAAPRRRFSATTAEAAVWAAAQGVGATRVLHYQCADAVARGDLVLLLTDQELEPLPVSLLHPSAGAMPLKLRVFLDFAAPRLRRSLEALAATGKFSPAKPPRR